MKTFLNFRAVKNPKINEELTSDKFILDKTLSVENISFELISEEKVYEIIKETQVLFREKYGKERPQRTSFFKRSVIGISKDTPLEYLHDLADELKNRYAITTISIHTFHDLRYKISKNINHHAILFHLFIDPETYKRIRLRKRQVTEIQTLVADILKMERGGKGGTKDRLKTLQRITAERIQMELNLEAFKKEHNELNKLIKI